MDFGRQLAQVLDQDFDFAAIAGVDDASGKRQPRAAIDDLSRNRAPRGSPDALVSSMAIRGGHDGIPSRRDVHIFGGIDIVPRSSPGCAIVGAFAPGRRNLTFSMRRMYQPRPVLVTTRRPTIS